MDRIIYLNRIICSRLDIGLAAIVGSIIAYTFARFINYSEAEVNDGLAGFNPSVNRHCVNNLFR